MVTAAQTGWAQTARVCAGEHSLRGCAANQQALLRVGEAATSFSSNALFPNPKGQKLLGRESGDIKSFLQPEQFGPDVRGSIRALRIQPGSTDLGERRADAGWGGRKTWRNEKEDARFRGWEAPQGEAARLARDSQPAAAFGLNKYDDDDDDEGTSFITA